MNVNDDSLNANEEPWFVGGTLDWCNERRVEKGMEPLGRLPKGKPRDPTSCPCGLATGLYVGRTCWGTDKEDAHSRFERLPTAVMDFVDNFDNGNLPQYEEKENHEHAS